jgi:tetratricopeptide (TPR) repeat protein
MSSLILIWLAAALAGEEPPQDDFEHALERARLAGARHRYEEVVHLLSPFSSDADPERRYVALAEIGRAWFHLGRYEPARRAFREAVVIHPERAETAIYLQASSYLTGDREQALVVFRALLEGGARDLYLAVTLSGANRFLAEPEVQELLARHAVPVVVDPSAGSVMGVALGQPRDTVRQALGLEPGSGTARSLSAEAGPVMLWAFLFDDAAELAEVILLAANMAAYTPYRLELGPGVDWRASPAAVIAAWGPPSRTSAGDDGVSMTWTFPGHDLMIDFAVPAVAADPARPPEAAAMRLVRLTAGPPAAPARMER